MDWNFSPDNIYGSFTRAPWEHQVRTVAQTCEKFSNGIKSLVVGCPTGGGKGLVTTSFVNLVKSQFGKTIIYNPRRLLTQQSLDRLNEDSIDAGARAASMRDLYNADADVQVAQLQTDILRVLNQERWELYDATLVIVDEAHMCMSPKALELFQRYLGQGAYVLGLTGTPVGMSGAYRDIVVAATNSELRACGAHVPARCFSVHEMDTSKITREKTGEFSDGAIMRECWSQAIVGYIYEDWRRLNPDALPTLCAAPGIGESIWVSEQFLKKGHRVAHIDCEKVVVNGETYQNDAKGVVRNQVLKDAKNNEFDVVCHCQVLAEGIDIPSLRHLILARPYGALANYIQSVGRVIRSAPGKHVAVVQDHGGNAIRHGSPNADRDWAKMFHMTEKEIAEQRKRDVQEGKQPNPIVCIKCGTMRSEGIRCPACGYQADPRSRLIVEKSGKLVEVKEDMFAPPKPPKPKEIQLLNNIFFAVRNKAGKSPSDNQVLAIYAKKHGDYPAENMVKLWLNEREAARNRKNSFR
jgi:superfamily II DNA or RNA helicase